MRLLLDTHILLALLGEGSVLLPRGYRRLLGDDDIQLTVSTASLWEISIKFQSGKLQLGLPLELMQEACAAAAIDILPIEPRHVLYELTPLPTTRDPFDRLLLAQAGVDGLRLVTLDAALVGHPLVWTPAS